MPVPRPNVTSPSTTSLSITNPLVLYRTLLATNRLKPDPAQHRLALQLQKLYFRLKDYRPEVEYRRQLDRVTRGLSSRTSSPTSNNGSQNGAKQGQPTNTTTTTDTPTALRPKTSFLNSLLSPKATADMKALLPSTPLHDTALTITSPQGMLLYGEVGRGKSMLLDLLFNALPSDRKRRWHFSTFMLDVFRRLEVERMARARARSRSSRYSGAGSSSPSMEGMVEEHEHVVLALARETVETSPVLFLDEFQMPDRASSRLVNGFLTGFFGLGGVLVASSNRMPEELSKGVGVRFVDSHMPGGGKWGRGGWMGSWGMGRGSAREKKRDETERFVEVLKARCEVWEMEGQKDWRREADEDESAAVAAGLEEVELDLEKEQPVLMKETAETAVSGTDEVSTPSSPQSADSPPHYHLSSLEEPSLQADITKLNPTSEWTPFSLTIYGRTLTFPQTHFTSGSTPALTTGSTPGGVLRTSFSPLLTTPHGPADFVSLASHFHSVILTDVPILTSSTKNEARRLIWLIDALYEAGCRLVISADAPVGGLFFPETRRRLIRDGERGRLLADQDQSNPQRPGKKGGSTYESDSIESEAFSEMYQDSIAPFRANVSSYDPKAEWRSADPTFAPMTTQQQRFDRARNVLADEDADFGPTYGNGRGHGMSASQEGMEEILRRQGLDDGPAAGLGTVGMRPDFTDTRVLVGEDERFAYKRARSRLWEMCGNRWWRERSSEDVASWWRPEGGSVAGQTARFWEGALASAKESVEQVVEMEGELDKERQGSHDAGKRKVGEDEGLFRHGASPYRTSEEAPPKFGWQHAWGMMSWGKKAGEWGKGVEGDRRKEREGKDSERS